MLARTFFVTLLVGLLIAAALAEGPIGSQTTLVPSVSEPDRVEEDEPCWHGWRMGEKLCDPAAGSEVFQR